MLTYFKFARLAYFVYGLFELLFSITYFYIVDLVVQRACCVECYNVLKTTPIYNFAYLLWQIIIIPVLNNDPIIVFVSVVMK